MVGPSGEGEEKASGRRKGGRERKWMLSIRDLRSRWEDGSWWVIEGEGAGTAFGARVG